MLNFMSKCFLKSLCKRGTLNKMFLKLSKKVDFFNFVLTSVKSSKYVKAIYI